MDCCLYKMEHSKGKYLIYQIKSKIKEAKLFPIVQRS